MNPALSKSPGKSGMKVSGADELGKVAAQFAMALTPHTDRATVAALSGDLGAGKTTFTQGVAKALGVAETVTSPTFVLEKIYKLEGQPFSRLIHIDAYRLTESRELEVLGWWELLNDPQNLILVEWPEQIPEFIPADAIRISFEINGEGRILTFNGEENGTK